MWTKLFKTDGETNEKVSQNVKPKYAVNRNYEGLNVKIFEVLRVLSNENILVRDVATREETLRKPTELILLTSVEQIRKMRRRTSMKLSYLTKQVNQYSEYDNILKGLENE